MENNNLRRARGNLEIPAHARPLAHMSSAGQQPRPWSKRTLARQHCVPNVAQVQFLNQLLAVAWVNKNICHVLITHVKAAYRTTPMATSHCGNFGPGKSGRTPTGGLGDTPGRPGHRGAGEVAHATNACTQNTQLMGLEFAAHDDAREIRDCSGGTR